MKRSGAVTLIATLALAFGLQGCATTGNGHGALPPGSTFDATGGESAIITEPSRNQPVVKADNKQNFEAVMAAIKQQMGAGGRWQYVSAKERTVIDATFADMAKLFDQYGSVDRMNANTQARLLTDQSTVNAILTREDGDRIVCTSYVPVGTHFPRKVCKPYSQIQAEQFQAQKSLQDLEQRDRFRPDTH